jgi:trimeric autotransporter adhesin
LVNASNKVRIGDINVTVIEGEVAFSIGSDARFKFNISEDDVKGLNFINRLRPVVYNFDTRKHQDFLIQKMPDSVRNGYLDGKDFEASTSIRRSGFIAQEVEEAAIEVGYNFDGLHIPDSKSDSYSLAYSQFVVPLVKAVQELSHENQEMQKMLAEMKITIEHQKKEAGELKSFILKNAANTHKGSIEVIPETNEAILFQNIPNPFNQSTTISYSIPNNAKNAAIIITSQEGKRVAEFDLTNKEKQSITISAGILSPGLYIYSLIIDDKLVDSKKMILTR